MRKQIKPLIPIAVTAAMLAGASPALAEEIDTTPAEPDQTVTTPTDSADENQTGDQEQTPAEDKDVIAEGDSGHWHIKLLGTTKTGKTDEGKALLMVSAEVTNNTGEDGRVGSIDFKAYQNGQELKPVSPAMGDALYADYKANLDMVLTNIQNGVTRTVSEFFELVSDNENVKVNAYQINDDQHTVSGEFTAAGDPVVDVDVPTEDPSKPDEGTEKPGEGTEKPGEDTENPSEDVTVADLLKDAKVTVDGYDLVNFDPQVLEYYVTGDIEMTGLPEGWTGAAETDETTGDVTWKLDNEDKTMHAEYVFHKIGDVQEDSEYNIENLKDMHLMAATADGELADIEGFDPQRMNYVVPGVTAVDATVPDGWYHSVLHDAESNEFRVYVVAPDNTYFANFMVTAEEQPETPNAGDDENTDTPDDGQSQDEPKTDGEDKGDGDSLPQTGVVAPFAALAGLGASLLAGLGVKFGSRKGE